MWSLSESPDKLKTTHNILIFYFEIVSIPPQWVRGALYLGTKLPGRVADYSPSSSDEVKNACSYTSTPPVCLHGMVLRDFILLLLYLTETMYFEANDFVGLFYSVWKVWRPKGYKLVSMFSFFINT
jgi:hypothetical protein